MKTLVFFLEEPSAKEMLTGLIPRLVTSEISIRYIVFTGKQDMEKQLIKRLRGWQLPDSIFVVMRDQDSSDCQTVKQRLTGLCQQAGKIGVLVRVACRELESFYLGDLSAVERGLDMRGLSVHQNSKKFRNPDNIDKPSDELYRLTGGRYQKMAGSRAIAPHLRLKGNRSHSFQVLIKGISQLLGDN